MIEYVLNAPLPKGVGLAKVTISAEDIGLWCAHKWRVNAQGYVVTFIKRRAVYLHRAILAPEPGLVGDHINHDPLDNRRANLRGIPQLWNTQNRKPLDRDNTSGFRGVVRTHSGTWQARGNVKRKTIHIGNFATAEEAGAAAAEWRAKHYPGIV